MRVEESTTAAFGFDEEMKKVLEGYATLQPTIRKELQGPWTAILSTLFPPSEGYMVEPIREASTSDQYFDIGLMVSKFDYDSRRRLQQKDVLYAEFRPEIRWPDGVELFEKFVQKELYEKVRRGRERTVYWVACIGAHWRYGKYNSPRYAPWLNNRNELMVPLVEWQQNLHDDTSYQHLCALAREVKQL